VGDTMLGTGLISLVVAGVLALTPPAK
jgi:hypothetical protein